MLSQPRVLVVADEGPTRMAFEVALQDHDYEVRVEYEGSCIEKVVEQFRPHLAVLDVRLPEGPDGLLVARRLRGTSDIPIILLTEADEVEERLAGYKVGVDDCVTKPFNMAELLARMTALLRRSGQQASSIWQIGDLLLDESAHQVVRGDTVLKLTHTEFELLTTLAHSPGRVFSRAQLLARVWGFDEFGASNLVDVHMSTLRRKLEVAGARMIHTIRGAGYVLRA